jgi:hypothetical protein
MLVFFILHSNIPPATRAPSEALVCVSCAPAGTGASTGSASIGIDPGGPGGAIGGGSYDPPGQSAPMSASGEQVFFETEASLAPEDENGNTPPLKLGTGESTQEIPQDIDVCEWENGHIHLISGGQPGSTRLQGVTPSAFTSSVTLAQGAPAGAVSLYDARVDGGFPPAPSNEPPPCESITSCQAPPSEPPPLATPGTTTLSQISKPLTTPAAKPRSQHHNTKKRKKKKHKRRSKNRRHRASGGKSHRPGAMHARRSQSTPWSMIPGNALRVCGCLVWRERLRPPPKTWRERLVRMPR